MVPVEVSDTLFGEHSQQCRDVGVADVSITYGDQVCPGQQYSPIFGCYDEGWISGVPNWLLYGVLGLAAIAVASSGKKKGYRR
jgi:hypothetical protein